MGNIICGQIQGWLNELLRIEKSSNKKPDQLTRIAMEILEFLCYQGYTLSIEGYMLVPPSLFTLSWATALSLYEDIFSEPYKAVRKVNNRNAELIKQLMNIIGGQDEQTIELLAQACVLIMLLEELHHTDEGHN